MTNVQIVSTSQNRANQKRAIHYSSSTVFFAIFNPDEAIDTEISLLNHFILKINLGSSNMLFNLEIFLFFKLIKKN